MSSPTIAEQLAEAKEVYTVFGKAEQALKIMSRVVQAEPQNVEALNLYASILYELDRDEEARVAHEAALCVEPCSVEALHGLAALANDDDQYEEAMRFANRAFTCLPRDPHPELRDNEDYRQRLVAELYKEKAFSLWYLGQREDAVRLLTEDGPADCPLEVENFEDEIDWLENHPDTPDE